MPLTHYLLKYSPFIVFGLLLKWLLRFDIVTHHASGAPDVARRAVVGSHQRFQTSILARLNVVREMMVLQRKIVRHLEIALIRALFLALRAAVPSRLH